MIRTIGSAWPGPARVGLALALSAAALVVACETVSVVAPDVVRVEMSVASHTLLPNATVQLVARVLDADGNTLARSVQWTTSDAQVATVSSNGLVRGVTAGAVTIRASVEGHSGTTTITVLEGPAIAVDPGTVVFAGLVGESNPATQTVSVTNARAGTLRDLATAVTYVGVAADWLDAVLTTTTAPAQLRLSVKLDELGPGIYEAAVAVSSQGASNSPQIVEVTLDVSIDR